MMGMAVLLLWGVSAMGGVDAALLDSHDPVWETAPVAWNTGIPLANGAMGALIWGDGAPLRITLDKYDAWETREKGLGDFTYAKLRELVAAGRREEAEQCMRTEHIYGGEPYPTRLPMPRLEIDFGASLDWREARLSLRTARATLQAKAGNREVSLEFTVHANRNVFEIRFRGAPVEEAKLRLGIEHLNEHAKETLKRWGYPAPEVTGTPDNGTFYQQTPGGYAYAIAWRREDGVIRLAVMSTEDAADPRVAAQSLVTAPADTADHEAWWAEYWARSWLTIPDARLEALYYIEMYKLACSSRPGHWPATLQGLWTLDGGMPPWSGDYHLDMNVQQTYWPIYPANRLELGEPLYARFSDCIPRWRRQCQEFFGFDGIWAGCAIGLRGERIFGYSGVELWPGNAAWLAHHYWLHWRYSQDREFLREQALPMMRLSFLTYANLLEKGEDGKLHIPLSYSPEYGEGSFEAYRQDPTVDLALIRWLGQSLLDTYEVLGEQDELTARIRDVLANLTDYPRRGDRLMVSAGQALDHSHRHHSHLMGIHPLGLFDIEREADQRIIRASLHDIRARGVGEWTGWAFPWMSLIASRAGYGNMAWQMLDVYANSFIKPNTFHVNGDPRIFGLSLFDYEPMTLEAGFGAAAAIMEMLLQSHNGRIQIFPTLPDRWHDAYFENLRAEGAFVVTAKLEKGAVTFARIASEAGGLCRVRNPWDGPVTLESDGRRITLEGSLLEFDTQAGKTYTLTRGGAQADVAPIHFERGPLDPHFYGVKKLPRF